MTSPERDPEPILLTGASGYVGSHLLDELLARGRRVRALVRDPDGADLPPAVQRLKGDAVKGEGLAEALEGVRTAYYLIHSMGRGANPSDDFAKRDRAAAVNFGEAASAAGVERVVYLGGLGPTGPGRLDPPALPPRGRGAARPARAPSSSTCAPRW